VNAIQHDVNMEVSFIVVRRHHVLMLAKPERRNCLLGGIFPLSPLGMLSRLPCDLEMHDWVANKLILTGNRSHLIGNAFRIIDVAGQNHFSPRDFFARCGVSLNREVLTKFVKAGVSVAPG
jgi:hypothetical protein